VNNEEEEEEEEEENKSKTNMKICMHVPDCAFSLASTRFAL
jgi:hypothetical protein